MKKIYNTLAVAVLCAVSANAAGINVPAGMNKGFSSVSDNLTKVEAQALVSENTMTTRAAADVAGAYAWQGYWMLSNKQNYQRGGLTVDIQGTKAYVSGFTGTPAGDIVALEGVYDPDANTISISAQDCGMYDDGTNQGTLRFVYHEFPDNESPFEEVNKPMVIKFEDGRMIFPEMGVIDISVFVGTQQLGYMTLTQANSGYKYPTTLDNTGWQDYGVAAFTDAWVATLFSGLTEEESTWNVKVQKRTVDGSTYLRLVDPYGEGAPDFIQEYNESPCQGSIVLDVTDEKCVMAVADISIPSGFYLPLMGLGMMYNYSEAGFEWYDVIEQGEEPYTYEEMIEGMGTKNIGELKDGAYYIYNCSFGYSVRCGFAQNTAWSDGEKPVEMTCKVVVNTAGVNDIVSDNANAPVKYYNLQGVEVAAPEAGQLVIKKQGSQVTKLIAK